MHFANLYVTKIKTTKVECVNKENKIVLYRLIFLLIIDSTLITNSNSIVIGLKMANNNMPKKVMIK